MFRRRRPLHNESIHFSFDSFLDLVTNVVGIIIRLILVTWVGARSYHASMNWLDLEPLPAEKQELKITDDPLHARLEMAKNDLDDAKSLLLQRLRDLEAAEQKKVDRELQLSTLVSRRNELDAERKALESKAGERGSQVRLASLSVEQVRQRSRKLLEEIKKIEAAPSNKKQLKYHAPLSKAVHSDEMFFECKAGRVTYIDLPAFMQEVKLSLDEAAQELKSTYRVERSTPPVGPFRLRYAIERERSPLDVGATPPERSFHYGLSEWVVEPLSPNRGETLELALRPKSDFRQLTDHLDSKLTIVTFWVYPDSFELFRELRDHLYERGLDIAGRPLPPEAPIAASKHGTASRGQ